MQNEWEKNVETKYPQTKPSLSLRKRVGKMSQNEKEKEKKKKNDDLHNY